MKTTHIVTRTSVTTATVTTKHDDVKTSLVAYFSADQKNMGGTLGAWGGDYPSHATEIVAAIDGIEIGHTIELTFGATEQPIPRAYPYDPAKAAEWDARQNEGGEGYNPYR